MRLRTLALLCALSLTGPVLAADDVGDVTSMRLVLTLNEHVILSETLYVTDSPAYLRVGTDNGYPVRTCAATQQTLTSVSLFAGWHVQVQRDPVGVQVHLVQHAVQTGQGAADARGCTPLTAQSSEAVTLHATVPTSATGAQARRWPTGSRWKLNWGRRWPLDAPSALM